MIKLFAPYQLGSLALANRVVMAPMTRNRALGNVPGDLQATYYAQRAAAGLIVTEGTAPNADGLGYARIPGCFSAEQAEGWKKVTQAVHQAGSRIFLQIMHTGRASHPVNMPEGARIVAPSAVALEGQIWTDQAQMQDYPVPQAMTQADIDFTVQSYAASAKWAIDAGFDGVELHGANGYLIDQFLNPASNQLTDVYGGSLQNRNNFATEVTRAVVAAIGADKVGIRLSPYGVFNGMAIHGELDAQFELLAKQLQEIGVAYVHLVDHSAMGAPAVPQSVKDAVRKAFSRTLILSGGYDAARAEADLQAGRADLVAFGRPFISNPNLVAKLQSSAELAPQDFSTFYTPGEKGYTDYV